MQIKWRSAIERKNIETILYGTTLGNSKMDQWIHLVFSTARTNSSFHSFFFQLVNFYDIFLLRQLAWDKKRITSSKNLYKFHRSWSLQKKERTHVSKRLRTKEIIMGWSSGEWIIIFIPTTPFPLKESIDVTYKSPRLQNNSLLIRSVLPKSNPNLRFHSDDQVSWSGIDTRFSRLIKAIGLGEFQIRTVDFEQHERSSSLYAHLPRYRWKDELAIVL